MDAVELIRKQIDWCQSAGVEILCCPEAILGGLADYAKCPTDLAIDVESGQLNTVLAPLASDTVTTILGFTEIVGTGHLYNSAAVFHRGSPGGRPRHCPAGERMDDWFSVVDARCELPAGAVQNLRNGGFVVIPGPVTPDRMAQLAAAYDAAVAGAAPDEVSIGSTTTRVNDFVNRDPEFDGLYVYEPVLEACCRIIGRRFKLSIMLAR